MHADHLRNGQTGDACRSQARSADGRLCGLGANHDAPKVRGPNSARPMVRHGRCSLMSLAFRCQVLLLQRQASPQVEPRRFKVAPAVSELVNTTSPACPSLVHVSQRHTRDTHAFPSRHTEPTLAPAPSRSRYPSPLAPGSTTRPWLPRPRQGAARNSVLPSLRKLPEETRQLARLQLARRGAGARPMQAVAPCGARTVTKCCRRPFWPRSALQRNWTRRPQRACRNQCRAATVPRRARRRPASQRPTSGAGPNAPASSFPHPPQLQHPCQTSRETTRNLSRFLPRRRRPLLRTRAASASSRARASKRTAKTMTTLTTS